VKHVFLCILLAMTAYLGLPATAFAQAPGVVIFDDDALLEQIAANGKQLLDAKKLVPLNTLVQQLNRTKCKLELAPTQTKKLDAPAVFEVARKGTLAVGLLARDEETGEWYFNAATGFVLTADGAVATCYHVLHSDDAHAPSKKEHHKKDEDQKGDPKADDEDNSQQTQAPKSKPGEPGKDPKPSEESYLIAADFEGHVYPILEVLAADRISDTCIVRIQAAGLQPLSFNSETRPGEAAFCFSNPSDMFGHFSQGIIARFFMIHEGLQPSADAAGPIQDVRPVCFLSVTCDFAVGSSGGPILDDRGNVIGQVQSTSSIYADPDEDNPKHPQMVVKAALAAREVLKLIEPQKSELLVQTPSDSAEHAPVVFPSQSPDEEPVTVVVHEELEAPSKPQRISLSRTELHVRQIQDQYEFESSRLIKQIEQAKTDAQLTELSRLASQLVKKTEVRCFRLVNAHSNDPAVIPALEYLVLHSEMHRTRAFELLLTQQVTSAEIGKSCVYLMHGSRGPMIELSQLEKLSRAIMQRNHHHDAVGLATLTLAEILARRLQIEDLEPKRRTQHVHETQQLLQQVMQHFANVRVPDLAKPPRGTQFSQNAGTIAESNLNNLHAMTRRDLENELSQKFFFDRKTDR
jgi:serine protease Do